MSVKLIFRVILDIICLVIGKVPNLLVLIFYNNLTKSLSRSNNCTRTSKLTVLFRSLILHFKNRASTYSRQLFDKSTVIMTRGGGYYLLLFLNLKTSKKQIIIVLQWESSKFSARCNIVERITFIWTKIKREGKFHDRCCHSNLIIVGCTSQGYLGEHMFYYIP